MPIRPLPGGPVRAVLFDLDETLLDRTGSLAAFLGDQHDRFRARLGGVALEAWSDRFLALDAKGMTPKPTVYARLAREFGLAAGTDDDLAADYAAGFRRHARGNPGMAETLAALRARGLRLGVVTNGETAFQTGSLDALGLPAMVDAILISAAEGVRKPDPAIFERAARRLAVSPVDCLFVGDNPIADVAGAVRAGLRAAWFRNGARWPKAAGPGPTAAIDLLAETLSLVDAAVSPEPSARTAAADPS